MPIRKRTRGTGITEQELTVVEAPFGKEETEKFREMFRRLAADTKEPAVKKIEAWARDILVEAGVPDTKWAKLSADGTFSGDLPDGWEKDPSLLGPRNSAGNTLSLVSDKFGWDSLEGYAARALQKLSLIQFAIKHDDGHHTVDWAIELGALMQERIMKFRHQTDAERGLNLVQRLTAGRDRFNADRAAKLAPEYERWREERDKVLRVNPKLSKTSVAGHVKKNLGLDRSVRHITRILSD